MHIQQSYTNLLGKPYNRHDKVIFNFLDTKPMQEQALYMAIVHFDQTSRYPDMEW